MNTPAKPAWQSKTFWATLLSAIIGGYTAIAPNYHWDTNWVPGAVIVLGALGLWGIRTADSTIGTPSDPSPVQPDNVVPTPQEETK